jgi:Ca-activated chloride channel homolog
MSGDCSGCGAFGPFGEVEGSRPARIQDANRRTRSGPLDLLRRLSLAIAAGLPIVTAPGAPSAAMVDWLVLLVDASESIDPHEYRLQRQAYVNVLRDPAIALLLEGARIAIVEFATTPQVVVAWTDDPRRAARAYAGHTGVIRGPGPASLTGIARALALALDMLEGKAGRKVVDISGDGPDNVDWFAGVWSQRRRARQLRIEINGLAIPTPEEPTIDTYYAQNVITGFLEISREHVDFERSLLTKMHIEIAGAVPE